MRNVFLSINHIHTYSAGSSICIERFKIYFSQVRSPTGSVKCWVCFGALHNTNLPRDHFVVNLIIPGVSTQRADRVSNLPSPKNNYFRVVSLSCCCYCVSLSFLLMVNFCMPVSVFSLQSMYWYVIQMIFPSRKARLGFYSYVITQSCRYTQ